MGNVPAVDRQAWLHDEVKAFFEDGALLFKSGAIAVILEAQRINQDRDKKGGLNIRQIVILKAVFAANICGNMKTGSEFDPSVFEPPPILYANLTTEAVYRFIRRIAAAAIYLIGVP